MSTHTSTKARWGYHCAIEISCFTAIFLASRVEKSLVEAFFFCIYAYHCGWVPFRLRSELKAWDRGDSPTLTVVGCHLAQGFRLQPELEAWDRGNSPTLTVVGCHWGLVILTSARIGSPGPRRFPYSHCAWLGAIWPRDSDFGQNWKPGTGEIPILFSNPSGILGESQAIHTPLGLS
jgi:hypothetical protein